MTAFAATLDENGIVALAQRLAPALRAGGGVHLQGDLGAGKTTLARALLRALGVGGRIKSPTYGIVESYETGRLRIHHLDLYRLADPGELDFLGLDDLTGECDLLLIEWPERGGDALPPPDLLVHLAHAGARRRLSLTAGTPRAARWIAGLRPPASPPVTEPSSDIGSKT